MSRALAVALLALAVAVPSAPAMKFIDVLQKGV